MNKILRYYRTIFVIFGFFNIFWDCECTQVVNLQAELSYLQAHLATLELPSPPPPPPPASLVVTQPPLSISDLPSASSMPPTYDLSSLFDPMVHPSSWPIPQQRQVDPRQFGGSRGLTDIPLTAGGSGGGDLQALARELLHRHSSTLGGQVPCTESSMPPSISK